MFAYLLAAAPPFSGEVMFKLLTHFNTFKFRRHVEFVDRGNEMKQKSEEKSERKPRAHSSFVLIEVAGNFQFMIPTFADIKIP